VSRLDERRVALVTGAGGAIGRACAVALAQAGCDVAVNGLGGDDAVEVTCAAVRAAGQTTLRVDADVGDEAHVTAMFREIDRAFGRIDVLVNNAGVTRNEDIFETSLASWEAVMRTNLTGAYLCAKAAMTRMRDAGRGGRLIQVSSVVAHQGALKGHAHYAASKAGLLGLTKTLARSGAPYGITVNAVAPGLVDTNMLRATHGEAGIAALRTGVPLDALATPDDVAAAVAYLCSDGARHVTGAVLDVNGGLHMR
jgi:3-oxoacyl-[acyl-carrier protein] reductase